MLRRRSTLLLLAASLGLAPCAAVSQVVVNPNQIRGTFEFTNANPAILAILDLPGEQGITGGNLGAFSQPPAPPSSSDSDMEVQSFLRTTYEITVESSDAGIVHAVGGAVTLVGQPRSHHYVFYRQLSNPAFKEPAPDVELNFAECVGLFHFLFQDLQGDPVALNSGSIQSSQPDPLGGSIRYSASLEDGITEEYMAVRGDGLEHTLRITLNMGTDRFLDQITYEDEITASVGCDEIVQIPVVVPNPDGGSDLATITGTYDILGEEENPIPNDVNPMASRPLAEAEHGPWGNKRLTRIEGVPADGSFLLPNIVPSDVVDPPDGYFVFVDGSLRRGRRYQRLRTPSLDAEPAAGETLDLGDAFVMLPARVTGILHLAGPPPAGSGVEVLRYVFRDSDEDSDGDGIPDSYLSLSNGSYVSGSSTPGSGIASCLFEGEYDPAVEAFVGDYEMILAAPYTEPVRWSVRTLRLLTSHMQDPGDPENRFHAAPRITDRRGISSWELGPGGAASADFRYCFGKVLLRYRTTEGELFNPSIRQGTGSFDGLDFEGNPARYDVSISLVAGTPGIQEPASTGLVVMPLPAGTYTMEPTLVINDPGGGTTNVTLPPIEVEVGCRQVIDLQPGIQVRIDTTLPICSDSPSQFIEGSVTADLDIARIAHSTNGGAEQEVCAPCGPDPAFNLTAALEPGDNFIRVSARDTAGLEAAVTLYIRYAPEPSALDLDPAREPVRVARNPDHTLRVSWEQSRFDKFNLYAGTLDSLSPAGGAYDHLLVPPCGRSDPVATFDDPAGDLYFLVTATCGFAEGSYGRDSAGRDRPPAADACP